MNLLKLSWYSLLAKPLTTLMSLLLLTMGVSIISLLLLMNHQLERHFTQNIQGIDMVVGAKGSPLQLILSAVYHVDNPTGNVSLAEANKLRANPLVETGIPLAYGDNYKGYRILGTEPSYVDHYQGTMAAGRLWETSFEVTLGSAVAQQLGLGLGASIVGSHGSSEAGETHEEHPYTVVGILAPSGSVLDQLILTSVSSVWNMHADHPKPASGPETAHDHAAEEEHEHDHAHEAEEPEEITAMLLKFRSPMGMVMLPRLINEQTSMQAALPAIEINRLFGLFGVGIDTLRAVALAIMIISGISVFISLYNSLKDRRYELALMRTLGASRWQLFQLIVQEGLLLSVLGFTLGMLLSRGGLWILATALAADYHYEFGGAYLLPAEGWLAGITLLIGFVAALIPGLRAFNLNISQTLADG